MENNGREKQKSVGLTVTDLYHGSLTDRGGTEYELVHTNFGREGRNDVNLCINCDNQEDLKYFIKLIEEGRITVEIHIPNIPMARGCRKDTKKETYERLVLPEDHSFYSSSLDVIFKTKNLVYDNNKKRIQINIEKEGIIQNY